MKAVLCHSFDGAAGLALGDIDAPTPKAGEVLIDVHAAAVSFMDGLMAAGKYQLKPPLPYVPGTDAAGVVAAVGEGVTRFKPGDRVCCGHWFGAWADRMVATESNTVHLPSEVDFATGTTVRYSYGTAHYALVECARLQPGETVFVTGAAGGVGLAVVDLAHHLGARVIAGVGSAAKAGVVREYGAQDVIDYGSENVKERIKALTGGRGVDVFFDNVGGEVFSTMTRLMNWGGRMLPIGFTSGEIPSVAMNLPLLKNYSIVGVFWGAWMERFPHKSVAADEALMALVASGALRPRVSQRLPLAEFAKALDAIGQRQTAGRVVLELR
jgi:NADPH2:quinone reductase